MSKKIVTLGTLISPESAPSAGFWESINFLDQNGYFFDTQNYPTALARAGVRCVNPKSANASPVYAVQSSLYGLFHSGVSPLGRDLLEILAYEGFEGEVCDEEGGIVYVLSGGNLLRYASESLERTAFLAKAA